MKRQFILLTISFFVQVFAAAQKTNHGDLFTKVDAKLEKTKSTISVFQPYVLKARQLFYDAKGLVNEIKQPPKNDSTREESAPQSNDDPIEGEEFIRNYIPDKNLPINREGSINSDGSGNWGNQNNGLYGNCLDVLTGTIMGLGEAEENSRNVDVIFIAANDSYQLWSPQYAKNEVAAEYTNRATFESVARWPDINETEIAESRLTIRQFDNIQTNHEILHAVKSAHNYSAALTLFGKLEGKVFAVKTELEDRTVYGLVAVQKHYGSYGSNGYLKVRIKTQGIDNNQNGEPDTEAYIR